MHPSLAFSAHARCSNAGSLLGVPHRGYPRVLYRPIRAGVTLHNLKLCITYSPRSHQVKCEPIEGEARISA
jgi:hypothetical protein